MVRRLRWVESRLAGAAKCPLPGWQRMSAAGALQPSASFRANARNGWKAECRRLVGWSSGRLLCVSARAAVHGDRAVAERLRRDLRIDVVELGGLDEHLDPTRHRHRRHIVTWHHRTKPSIIALALQAATPHADFRSRRSCARVLVAYTWSPRWCAFRRPS